MRKIVIHIGTHKTATTAIQNTFAANRELLAANRIIYPKLDAHGGHHGLAAQWVNLGDKYRLDQGIDAAWLQVEKLAMSLSECTVFLSSEEFSRAGLVNAKELRSRMKIFDEVSLMCVVRSQSSFLQSVYGEVSKNRQPKQVSQLILESIQSGRFDGLWVNYNGIIDQFKDAFAENELSFLSYHEMARSDGGVFGTLLRELGAGLSSSALASAPRSSMNVSRDPLAVWVANVVSEPRVASQALVRVAAMTLKRAYGDEVRTTVFTEEERELLCKRFSDANRSFCEKTSIDHDQFQSEFINEKGDIDRGSIDGSFWFKLARALEYQNPA